MDYKETIYKIIGAAMEVHSQLGWGLLEPVYQEALALELNSNGVPTLREVELPIFYKEHLLAKKYRMDLVVSDDIIVELKSTKELMPEHRLQLFNYLRLTKKHFGVLINFGEPNLHAERYVYDSETNKCHLVDKDLKRISKAPGNVIVKIHGNSR